MIRKGLKPRFRLGLDLPDERAPWRKTYRFRRSWLVILIVLAIDVAFVLPAAFAFRQALAQWSDLDSLFSLVAAIFLTAWLVGWSLAPLILTTILVLMLAGREVVRVTPTGLEILLGFPGFGLVGLYDPGRMRNLRFERPVGKSGNAWRGPHFLFDYGGSSVSFGSNVDPGDLPGLKSIIETSSGKAIRSGEALPEELPAGKPDEPMAEPPVAGLQEAPAVAAPVTLASPSTLALIIANLVPLAGTVLAGWSLSDVMVLYWAESAVIGVFNVLRIIRIGRWKAAFAAPFFLVHFGGFMAVHFLFIWSIFVQGMGGESASPGDLQAVGGLFLGLWPALLALFLSHGYSFFRNFIAGQEYRNKTVNEQMTEPYGRIVFMHLVLILGGGLTMVLGEPTPVLLGVIILKIVFDIRAHLKEHNPA
jgi:hypothetical protein